MVIRVGTDIVYIPRIQSALDLFGARFLQRVYTSAEQRDCGYTHQVDGLSQKASSNSLAVRPSITKLAGRWAAKEAVTKALGIGWRGVQYTDIEIRRQPTGAPQVLLHRAAAQLVGDQGQEVPLAGDCQWQLSISHDGDYAIATAILIYSPSTPSP